MDLLTLLPIKDEKVMWNIDENHKYDILMFADAVGKVWSIPYHASGYRGELKEFANDASNFTAFIEWIEAGKKPETVKEVVTEHYDYYSNFISEGLAEKCLNNSKYRYAMYDAMKERMEKQKANVSKEQYETVAKEFDAVFSKMENSAMLSTETIEEIIITLSLVFFRAMPPFKFIGVYHWDGDSFTWENKNFKAGQPFVDGFNIPKSAEFINDKELSKLDFVDYNTVFNGE